MRIEPAGIPGMKVTVMGLGVNGGGLPSARFFASRGAEVTVTDLRGRESLKDSIDQLEGLPVRFVLGKHEEKDFQLADLVIKNPAVPPVSPYLEAARARGVAIETDISIFLSIARNPILAVTGTKGKSTTASAIAFGLSGEYPGTRLGGNITVSPLAFIDDLDPRSPVVLELSSWQLGDLKGRGLLAPVISAFTVILPDHLDRYDRMSEYIADKKVLFHDQTPDSKAVFNLDDPFQKDFPAETQARPYYYSSSPLPRDLDGAWLDGDEGKRRLSAGPPATETILNGTRIPGAHNRMNLLCAGLSLHLFGLKAGQIRESLADFPGIEHRLEMFLTWRGIRFYNDSAATIPFATLRALDALDGPLVLITGGTDKNIDFTPLAEHARRPEAIVLLSGTATEKMLAVLGAAGVGHAGPFDDIRSAVKAAVARARPGGVVLFSPASASFGMFQNEFDRGRRFKDAVLELTGKG